jgi:hypothetical protein
MVGRFPNDSKKVSYTQLYSHEQRAWRHSLLQGGGGSL